MAYTVPKPVLDRRERAALDELARVYLGLPKIKKGEAQKELSECKEVVVKALAGGSSEDGAKLKHELEEREALISELVSEINALKADISIIETEENETEDEEWTFDDSAYRKRIPQDKNQKHEHEDPVVKSLSSRDRERYASQIQLLVDDWYFEPSRCPFKFQDILKLTYDKKITNRRVFQYMMACWEHFIEEGEDYKTALKKLSKKWNSRASELATSNATLLIVKLVFGLGKDKSYEADQYMLSVTANIAQKANEVENKWM